MSKPKKAKKPKKPPMEEMIKKEVRRLEYLKGKQNEHESRRNP